MMKITMRNVFASQILGSVHKTFLSDAKSLQNLGQKVYPKRCIHVSGNSKFWEKNRKGGFETKDTLSNREHFKRGVKLILPETKKFMGEVKEHFAQDNIQLYAPPDGVIDKYFEFNGPESLDSWVGSCDSDNEGGFSTANVTISQSGFGCFSGNLCTRVPKTGRVRHAGYASIRYVPPLKSFGREHTYVWVMYTHMVLRIRGDGRTYMVNIHTHNLFDTSWLDMYSYVLHTRGGPYWQETWIPFSKFFLHHKGRIQDKQVPVDLSDIRNFSITLMDQNDGHYNLEIDYVGCSRDPNHVEEFAYESYYVPRWSSVN